MFQKTNLTVMTQEERKQLEKTIDKIIDEIKDESCILVMGPEFCFLNENDDQNVECIQDHLASREDIKEFPYLSDEGLFYCTDESQNSTINAGIRKYYQALSVVPNPLYEKIAKIPFHVYVSLSPDSLPEYTFKQLELNAQFASYLPGLKPDESSDVGKPSKANPLIYNLMGTHRVKDSIVFTYEALFSYLYYMFRQEEGQTKKYIRESFSKATYFLFLGFRFDKWYLKLLFFLFKRGFIASDQFNIDGGYYKKNKIALLFKKPDVPVNILEYYKSEFQFNFLPVSQFEFIELLYSKCEKMLRSKNDIDDPELREIINRAEEGRLDAALKIITNINNRRDVEKALTGLEILYKNDNDKLRLSGEIRGDYDYNFTRKNKRDITDEEWQKQLQRIRERVERELIEQ